jgi:N-acetylglucosaminyldiphosphoundecaprenol N-acetyl-beta-D-mannosaminyltransferase
LQSLVNILIMRKKIIISNISTGDYYSFIGRILELSRSRISSYVCVANVHMLVEAYRDKSFSKILENSELVTPDGMPLVIALKLLYGIQQERVAGMDLLPDLLRKAEEQKLTVFIYGSTEDVLFAIKDKCKTLFPRLTLLTLSPPFRELHVEEEESIINQINESGAHLIFTALGCPKQEKWMAHMCGRINAVMIGLGGALPVFAELQTRAPAWMQRNSLEWVYRLQQEPGRLWKRYLTTNSLFLCLFIRQFVLQKLFKD